MPIPFLIVFVPMALTVLGQHLGGAWNFLAVAFMFGLIPLLDMVVGHNPHNPPVQPGTLVLQAHRWVALSVVPALAALLGWGAWVASHQPLSPLALAGLTLSVGICTGGIGITVAHELIHKSSKLDRAGGLALLANTAYMHFYIEHLVGHHGRVATHDDPATARLGESFYRYYPRAVAGSWLSAWGIEAERLARLGLRGWGGHNRMLWYVVTPLLIALALTLGWGPAAAAFYAAQAVVAFSLLEAVNYLEHYGLVRSQLENGRHERVTVMHSWSTDQRLTNYFLFNLQRHADHHVNAARPYPALQHVEHAPQLPTGYAGMVLLALVPPLWRRVMDPRVAAARSLT